jgi:hypothetical protein
LSINLALNAIAADLWLLDHNAGIVKWSATSHRRRGRSPAKATN